MAEWNSWWRLMHLLSKRAASRVLLDAVFNSIRSCIARMTMAVYPVIFLIAMRYVRWK